MTQSACDAACSQIHFLHTLFGSLEDQSIRYCVLHSWQGLPEKLPSDLDIAVHPHDRDKLQTVFRRLSQQGYQPVQCLNYFRNAHYFVFYWFETGLLNSVAIDIIFEHRRGGRVLTSGERLVAGRQRYKDLWIADAVSEFAYHLAKNAWKARLSARQSTRLTILAEELGQNRAEKIATELFGEKVGRLIVDHCLSGSPEDAIAQAHRRLWLQSATRHPIQFVSYASGEGFRRVKRWFQPTGIFVVILGPDGVGKSTLVGHLVDSLGPAFRRHRIFHWRPQVIAAQQETGTPSTNPHDEPPRGKLASIVYLFAFLLDYWLGYLFVMRPLLAKSTLIVFDRYFHDLLVDPLRYRYGGPLWLARVLSRLIPPPDLLFLVLDASEEIILSRKQELPTGEVRRLRSEYQTLANTSSSATLVKTDDGLEKTVAGASDVIAAYMASRFRRQHPYWFASARNEQ